MLFQRKELPSGSWTYATYRPSQAVSTQLTSESQDSFAGWDTISVGR
jgi:hypothetical protein